MDMLSAWVRILWYVDLSHQVYPRKNSLAVAGEMWGRKLSSRGTVVPDGSVNDSCYSTWMKRRRTKCLHAKPHGCPPPPTPHPTLTTSTPVTHHLDVPRAARHHSPYVTRLPWHGDTTRACLSLFPRCHCWFAFEERLCPKSAQRQHEREVHMF
jgi:hypothetical protein